MIFGATIRAVVYRLVALAFLAGAALLSGKANAQTYDQGSAWQACTTQAADPFYGGNVGCYDDTVSQSVFLQTKPVGPGMWTYESYPYANTCSSRPQGQPGMINGTLTSTGVCNAGCKMVPNTENANQDFTIYESGNSINFKQGTWVPTGGTCVVDPSTPAQPPRSDQGCHTTSSGHSVCRGGGQTCVTSPSGFRTCAADSSVTGIVRTNNPRTEATSISAPNTPNSPPANRPGEAWSTSTSTTTITNNTTSNVTNITNYNNTGTPNGNQPTPGDGSGGEEEGEEEEPGSVSGGGDCATPYSCSGGDPVLCSFGYQSWLQRCANDQDNNGQPDWTQIGEGGDEGPTPGDGAEVGAKEYGLPGLDKIDDSGFIGSSCPMLPVVDFGPFGQVDLSSKPWWCDLISKIGLMVLFAGACIALAILVS